MLQRGSEIDAIDKSSVSHCGAELHPWTRILRMSDILSASMQQWGGRQLDQHEFLKL